MVSKTMSRREILLALAREDRIAYPHATGRHMHRLVQEGRVRWNANRPEITELGLASVRRFLK